MKEKSPLVVICCCTYNHIDYIRQCLDGFVMQKTIFRFVAVVHDDFSTDGTTKILQEYSEKYSDIIIPIYEEENQYSKHDGSLERIINDAVRSTEAKYIAFCEGDDYWTDPYKLQKQVDFMESHPEFSMCFHSVDVQLEENLDSNIQMNIKSGEYSPREIYERWIVPTCSVLHRRGLSLNSFEKVVFGDIYRFVSLGYLGKIFCLDMKSAVYRRHKEGASVNLSPLTLMRLYKQYAFFEKLWPDLADISIKKKREYLEYLSYCGYSKEVWKYRYRWMFAHPSKFFSKYHLRTLLFVYYDITR